MGSLEAFALANKPWPSFLDGIGNAAGYSLILIIIAFFRELIGSGKDLAKLLRLARKRHPKETPFVARMRDPGSVCIYSAHA